MYYPYLFGKQKELLAVRRLAPLLSTENSVQPVLEPVRLNTTLLITLVACELAKAKTFVVINPEELDFENFSAAASYQWGRDLFAALRSRLKLSPQFLFPALRISASTTASQVAQFKKDFGSYTTGYVCRSPSLTELELAKAIGITKPDDRIFWHGAAPQSIVTSALQKRRCVWVESLFSPEQRNADYAQGGFFSDRHLTFSTSGYAGFSDFAVFRSTVSKGGGRPGAVAFHLTHKEIPSGVLHVEHFVSDRTDQKDNDDAGKFIEAIMKFKRATKRATSSFGLTAAAKEYLDRLRNVDPPSLATSKQLQVEHHLELVSGLLVGRF